MSSPLSYFVNEASSEIHESVTTTVDQLLTDADVHELQQMQGEMLLLEAQTSMHYVIVYEAEKLASDVTDVDQVQDRQVVDALIPTPAMPGVVKRLVVHVQPTDVTRTLRCRLLVFGRFRGNVNGALDQRDGIDEDFSIHVEPGQPYAFHSAVAVASDTALQALLPAKQQQQQKQQSIQCIRIDLDDYNPASSHSLLFIELRSSTDYRESPNSPSIIWQVIRMGRLVPQDALVF